MANHKWKTNYTDKFMDEQRLYIESQRDKWRICPATLHLHPNYQRCCSDCLERICELRQARGLDDDGSPLPSRDRPLCGAKNRKGTACVKKVIPGKSRCKFHGGSSTGPRTVQGKARIIEAQRNRWATWRELNGKKKSGSCSHRG